MIRRRSRALAAVALLDRTSTDVPWRLLSRAASALATAGDGEPADGLLERGATALRAWREAGEIIDPVEVWRMLARRPTPASRIMVELVRRDGVHGESKRGRLSRPACRM